MSIFDVLEAPAGSFTVDTTQQYIQITSLLTNVNFTNSAGLNTFRDGDNVYIESMRIMLPYQFGHADFPIQMELKWWQGGGTGAIPEFGFLGQTYMPKPAISLPMGIQLQAPSPGSGNFRMQLAQLTMRVSMQLVPAPLNGFTYNPTVQAVTRHTEDMTL